MNEASRPGQTDGRTVTASSWEQAFTARIAERGASGVEEYAETLAERLRGPGADAELLGRIGEAIARRAGLRAAVNAIDLSRLKLGLRKPRIGIYDHTWHFIGGAQKYGATMAEALRELGKITLIGNLPFSAADLSAWYRVDLGDCAVRLIPLPCFEKKGRDSIDPADIASRAMPNPFHAISRATLDYDVFINNSMLEMVLPLSFRSVFITHFPERRARSYFYVDRYDRLISNSRYTSGWIEKLWGLEPDALVYPPIDMPKAGIGDKEPIILSVARFDAGGNKQQLDMIRAFRTILRLYPKAARGWRLVLAGGSRGDNPYLREIREFLAGAPGLPVELRVNVAADELEALYARASLFWHFCGLGQSDPSRVEHFGMTVAEAMRSGCVPVVFNGGGMREIVRAGENGYLFSSLAELARVMVGLLDKPEQRARMAEGASRSGRDFSKELFRERIRSLVRELLPPASRGGL